MRRAWVVATVAFVGSSVGCFGTAGVADETDDGGTLEAGPGDGSSGTDTGAAPDTGTPTTDTGTPATDTGTPATDTGTTPADTGTTPADTGTTPTDTGTTPTDTGTTPTDTGTPPDTGPVAELSCSLASGATGTVDLGAGTLDFAHWGLLAKESWDHKSGGTYLLSKGTVKGGYGQFGAYPVSFTWSGGTPTASPAIATASGIWVSKKDDGFEFDVVASPSGETLVVWMARNDTALTVKATPSDAGLTTFTGDVSSTSSITAATLTCKIRGAGAGSKVSIQIRQQKDCGSCYASLLSASVKAY